jgi:hypothetical protein
LEFVYMQQIISGVPSLCLYVCYNNIAQIKAASQLQL